MNVRKRSGSGEVPVKFANAVTSRKGGEPQAKPIKNAVAMKPKKVGFKKVKGTV